MKKRTPVEYGRLAPRAPLPYDAQLFVHADGHNVPLTTAGDAVELIQAHIGGNSLRALARLRRAVVDRRVRAVRLDPVRALYAIDDVSRLAEAWGQQEDVRTGW